MRYLGLCVVLPAVILCLISAGMAEVPRLINYQGILTDSGGLPIGGSHNLTFKIYPDSVFTTSPLWTELQANVEVGEGLFNVILGSVTAIPDSLFEGSERWIGVSVDGDSEMTPRMRITSVPWALRAEVADTVLTAPPLAPHDHDDRYYTESELNSSGSINDPSNPVDWTKLKSVPAGFSDGVDNTGGATGGGWTDDGTVVRLETTTDSVGIGTTTPQTQLSLHPGTSTFSVISIATPDGSDNRGLVLSGGGGYGPGRGAYISLIGNDLWQNQGSMVLMAGDRPDTAFIALGFNGFYKAKFYSNAGLSLGNSYNYTKPPANGLLVEGYTGIGTLTPTERLHVNGNIAVEGGLTVGATYVTGSRPPASMEPKGSTQGKMGDRASEPAILGYSGTDPTQKQFSESPASMQDLLISPPPNGMIVEGDVGLGTDSPAEKLDVVGTIRSTGFKMITNPGDGHVLTSDSAGVASWQPNTGGRVPYVIYADLMDGETTGQKIKAAVDALPEWGGTVDARGFNPDSIHVVDVNMLENVQSNMKLILGCGVYAVSVPQTCIPPGMNITIEITGQGRCTTLKPTTSMTVLSVYPGFPLFNIRDLEFDLNGTNSTAIATEGGFTNNTIERIYARNNSAGSTAPIFRCASPLDVYRDIFINGGSRDAHGIEIHGEGVRVDHVQISGCNACINVEVGFPTTITNSLLSGNVYSLLIEGSVNTTIFENNNCEANSGGHVRIIGDAPHFPVNNTVIRDNYFTGINNPGSYGIYLEKVDNVLIEGNRFGANQTSVDAHAVVLGDYVSNISLIANQVTGVKTEILGYESAGLMVNDARATQTDGQGAYAGGVSVGGELTVQDLMRVEPSAQPTEPAEGMIYMDAVTHKLMVYDGTSWKACW